jgi:hypothetical protein
MRPVLNKMCQYESLLSGRICLVDIARMNEALDVQEENEARMAEEYTRD